ncbi:MAG: MMPL family transporter [Acidobacteriota bacterium]|nr:MMPL family transporter [Acidobacteriota bacterium]
MMDNENSSGKWRIGWPAGLAAALILAALFAVVPTRLTVESDVVAGLPAGDPVISDTRYALRQHGLLDTVLLDLSLPGDAAGPGPLVAAAERVSASLRATGLFISVGGAEYGESIAGLMPLLTARLPLLFDRQDLQSRIADSLRPEKIREALQADASLLRSLEGIGQAGLTARDPFGWRGLILSRLGIILPHMNARIVKGQVVSADERHILLPLQPVRPGTDTVNAARIQAAILKAGEALSRETPENGRDVQIVSAGAFRSTLDNERYSRTDARRATLISVLGIALLLLLAFPRPWLGLLCLIPAIAGAGLSLFTLSLFGRSLSILSLGFGGALVGIAIDGGIAFFAFLDRAEKPTTGWEASLSVLVVSLAAMLTTVGSFLALLLADFPILRQLGIFSALGCLYAFLFVHLVFPLVFKKVPPAVRKKKRAARLTGLTTRLALGGGRTAAIVFFIIGLVLALFAWPRFEGDLRTLNTVSPETLRAEQTVQSVWGNVLGNVYVLLEGDTPEALQARSDGLAAFLRSQETAGRIGSGFTPSMILPGPEAAAANLAAWKDFWTPEQIASVRAAMGDAQAGLGFSAKAFEPFWRSIESPAAESMPVPPERYGLLGIVRSRDGSKWLTLNPVAPGPGFDREDFARRVRELPGARILDYQLFADRLAGLLIAGFGRMLLICTGGLAVVLFLFFLEATLPLIILGHTVFSLVCTLGTLKLLGQPINIPSLALAVIIPGMGSDYALFFARGYQRFGDEHQDSVGIFRNAVFLTAASTMIGFGGLAAGRHVLLRSIGLTGLLATAYSALAAFILLPPILRRLYRPRPWPRIPAAGLSPGAAGAAVRRRYRHLEAYPRLFARLKLRLDPMFAELSDIVPGRGLVLDVGCGYGVPGAWLLARSPGLRVAGLEPNPKRAAAARYVFGDRGTVEAGAAPSLPGGSEAADTALLLDVVQELSDEDFEATLRALAGRLKPGGCLVIRTTIPGTARMSWPVRLEAWKNKVRRRPIRLRTPDELTAAVSAAGFSVERLDPSALGPRVVRLIAVR